MANQGKGGDEQIATMSYVKRLVRKKLRRQPEHEEQFLNIYPMLDMMTILVVFLLMQFAASSASSLQENKFLEIPYSTSREEVEEALPIVVAFNVILVDGEPAVTMGEGGYIDASHKRGGGHAFVIVPLLKKVEEKAKFAKALARKVASKKGGASLQEATETVLLAVDERIPYRTLSEVLYTVGQAGFKNIRFVVDTKKSTNKKNKKTKK